MDRRMNGSRASGPVEVRRPIELDEQGMATGVQYYLDLIAALPGADGLYIEPTGEGAQADKQVWSKHVEALALLLKQVQAARPEFESAIAIGRFNTHEYREAIHRIAPEKLHWFWAWGNPLDDKVLQEHPLVLRWHTTQRMSSYHGSSMPPEPSEASLTGMVTSWDPGMALAILGTAGRRLESTIRATFIPIRCLTFRINIGFASVAGTSS